jgi:hypothetical protein
MTTQRLPIRPTTRTASLLHEALARSHQRATGADVLM